MDVAKLGISVDSSDAVDASGDLDRLTASGSKTEGQMGKLASASSKANVEARRGRTDWRQIGLQFNQVSQQTAATGNFMQALSIQLPDILLGFGSVGIAAGIAAPAIAALGASFLGARFDAEALAESLDHLTGGISAYRSAAVQGADLAKLLSEEFGAVSLEAIELAERIQELRMAEILIGAANATDQLASRFDSLLSSELANLVRFFNEFEYTGEQSAAAAQKFAEQLERVRTAEGPREQLDAVQQLSSQLLEAAGSVDDMTEEQRDYYSLLLQTEQRLGLVVTLTGDMADNTGAAADEAERLSNNLIAAFNARSRLESGYSADGSVQGGRGTVVPDATDGIMAGLGGEFIDFDRGGRSGRGGGGRSLADQFQSDLERLQQQLMTEREVVDLWYEESQEILADRRALEILGEQEHKQALLALEEEYQNRVAGVRDSGNDHALSGASKFFGDMANATAKGSGAMFEITKKFGAAQGIVNSFIAFTEVIKDPSLVGRPWQRFSMAAAALSAGLGAVSSLRSVTPGGGGGGAISSGLTSSNPATLAQAPQVSREITLQLVGDEDTLYSRQSIIKFINGINEAQEDGAYVARVV